MSIKREMRKLKKRVAELERQVQAQPSLKEIVSSVGTEIERSLKLINP